MMKERKADGRRVSVRRNLPHPETGTPRLDQYAIAHWPRSVGIHLGTL
jgi:hypothetical protein